MRLKQWLRKGKSWAFKNGLPKTAPVPATTANKS